MFSTHFLVPTSDDQHQSTQDHHARRNTLLAGYAETKGVTKLPVIPVVKAPVNQPAKHTNS